MKYKIMDGSICFAKGYSETDDCQKEIDSLRINAQSRVDEAQKWLNAVNDMKIVEGSYLRSDEEIGTVIGFDHQYIYLQTVKDRITVHKSMIKPVNIDIKLLANIMEKSKINSNFLTIRRDED